MVSFGGNGISRISHDSKGLSNVVVVMLSLVIVVVIVVNVVLWSYQMNQFDLERMHENVKITDIAGVNGSSPWFPTESEFNVVAGSRLSGTYSDTQSVDGSFESFSESSIPTNGLGWWNSDYAYRRVVTIVNNAASPLSANYTLSVAMDTESLVSSGKLMTSGNDLRVVYDSGSSWVELDREVDGMNTSSTQVWFKTQASIPANSSNNNYYIYYGNPNSGIPPANQSRIYLWFDDFNRANEPDVTSETSYGVKTGGGTWSIENGTLKNVGASGDPNKLIITALGNLTAAVDMLVKIDVASFAGGDTSRMGLSSCMDNGSPSGSGYCGLFHNDRTSVDLLNDLRSWGAHASYSWTLNTWYYMRFRVTDPSSGLGEVKVWPVGTAEPTLWTLNDTFGGGSARNFGEVGFAGSRTSDTTYFDDIVVRYIVNPEPSTYSGSEESLFSNKLEMNGVFPMDVSTYPLFNVQTVEVTINYRANVGGGTMYLSAYNWTSSTFSSSGFNSTIGHQSTITWDSFAVNLTDQWRSYVSNNGTVYLKIYESLSGPNQTVIDVDFAGVRIISRMVAFTVANYGPDTTHLIALWIDNATLHQRYEISIYVNSGDTVSFSRADLSLPNQSSTVKMITERGNIAVFVPS
jgi:nitrogen fixation-related uncharacterized protein